MRVLAAIRALFSVGVRSEEELHLSKRLEEFCNHGPRIADLRALRMYKSNSPIRRTAKRRAQEVSWARIRL